MKQTFRLSDGRIAAVASAFFLKCGSGRRLNCQHVRMYLPEVSIRPRSWLAPRQEINCQIVYMTSHVAEAIQINSN